MEKLDIKPPSDDYEVIIGDGDWIIPEGTKFGAGFLSRYCDWVDSNFVGTTSIQGSIYAVPKWVDLKEGDVLPQGYERRSRTLDRDWIAGFGACVGEKLTALGLERFEYRAPAPPLRRMSDTADSLKAEIAKLKQENAQLAEKAENWRKLYSEKAKELDEIHTSGGWKSLRAKPIIDMTLREILQEAINSTEFDPEA